MGPARTSKRQTGPAARVRGLDGVRGVAAFLVMSYHVLEARHHLLGAGQTAMEIFFVLSGFVITRTLIGEGPESSLDAFYIRRVFRLLPALLAFMTATLVFNRIWYGRVPHNLYWMAGGALLYVSNMVLMFLRGGVSAFGGLWSLSIEEQFYLAWPMALRLLWRSSTRRILLLVGLVALASYVRRLTNLVPGASENWAAYGTDARALGLLLGCFAAILRARCAEMLSRVPRWMLETIGMAGITVLVATTFLVHRYVPLTFVTWWAAASLATTALMLVLSDDRPTVVVRLFGSPILVTLGKISYGLYLWHFFVLLVVMPHYQRLARLPDRGRYPIVVSISIVVAIISYMFIERPSVRVGRQLATELSERARRRRGEPNLLLPA